MLQFLLSISAEEDRETVQYVYDHFHNDMVCYAKSRLRNAEVQNYELETEDIVQESFLRIVKYIDRIDLSLGLAANKAYVFSITNNVIRDYLKKRVFFDSMEDYENIVEDNDDFIEAINMDEEYANVRKAVDELDEIYKITLLFYYDCNMTAKQIANVMEIPLTTVQSRLTKGRHILRIKLEGAHE